MAEVLVTVTRSAGSDGAVVVFIDTEGFDPTGDPGLRVLINDADAYVGKRFVHSEPDREADARTLLVPLSDIDYPKDATVCPRCEGSGEVTRPGSATRDSNGVWDRETVPCSDCQS